jgi:hypothetical protein
MPKPFKGKKPQGEQIKIDFGPSERTVYAVKKTETTATPQSSEPSPFEHFEETKKSKPST